MDSGLFLKDEKLLFYQKNGMRTYCGEQKHRLWGYMSNNYRLPKLDYNPMGVLMVERYVKPLAPVCLIEWND